MCWILTRIPTESPDERRQGMVTKAAMLAVRHLGQQTEIRKVHITSSGALTTLWQHGLPIDFEESSQEIFNDLKRQSCPHKGAHLPRGRPSDRVLQVKADNMVKELQQMQSGNCPFGPEFFKPMIND